MSQPVIMATPAHLRAKDVPVQVPPPANAVPAHVQAAPVHANVQVPVQAQVGPQAQPTSIVTWLQANWLICVVIVCVMLLIFVVGWVFFRTPAPVKPAKAGPGPPHPHAGVVHTVDPEQPPAQPNAPAAQQPTPQATQQAAQQSQQAAPALDFNALLQRGQQAIAQTKPVQPDETSEEEILRLMQTEPPKTPEVTNTNNEEPKIETVDEKKL